MSSAPRHSFSQRWADGLVRRPGLVLLVAGVLALLSTGLAVFKLDILSSRNALLADELEFNQRFLDWWHRFSNTEDLLVVADTLGADGSDQTEAARQFINVVASQLESEPVVAQVIAGAPSEAFSPRTARLLPADEFRQVLNSALDAAPLLESHTISQLLNKTVRSLAQSGDDEADSARAANRIDQLTALLRAINRTLQGDDAENALAALTATLSSGDADGWQYLTSPNGRFLFIRVTPRHTEGDLNALGTAIAAVRRHVNEVDAQFPEVDAGLTGVEVIEADETDAATQDATLASIVALLAISVLLIASFRSVRTPLMLVVTLLVGIAWSFGYLVLAIGHLQILSVIFVLVLLGLGIDFGIHFVSAFEAARKFSPPSEEGGQAVGEARDVSTNATKHPESASERSTHPPTTSLRGRGSLELASALARAGRRSFPSITLGAVTTALAFGTTAFTDFRGVAELGIIAAGGIVLCLLATFTVLPALIVMFHRNLGSRTTEADSDERSEEESGLLRAFHNRPTLTLLFAGVFLVICAWYATHIRFDYDLMRLQPKGVESVAWQDKLLKDGGVSAWFAVSIADSLDEARARAQRFAALPTVGQVTGIAMLFPPDLDAKLEATATTRNQLTYALGAAREAAAPPFSPAGEASALNSQLIALRVSLSPQFARQDLPADVRASLNALSSAIEDTIYTASTMTPTALNARGAALQNAYRKLRSDTIAQLTQLVDNKPLTPEDFPSALLQPYIDITDPAQPRFAIEIHPNPPAEVTNALDPTFLPVFFKDLESVDADVTGVLVQIYYTGSLMLWSYIYAGALAVALVVIVLTISLRSLYDTLLCIVPVALGFGAVLAAMELTEHTLNAANIIILPLMFGIGVDSGVHVVHRFRQHPTARPLGLAHGTGKGIAVTSVTTIIGFGAMLLARHRGIQSLGLVMALGITLTLLACLIVLPAWLKVRNKAVGS